MQQSGIRLDKYLADAGCGTRSEVKKMIREGKVLVDGTVVRAPERKILPGCEVSCCGRPVRAAAEHVYYLLNKPAGYLSATRDSRAPTVLSLIPEDKRRDIFPVGRLDKDTEGLLLLTDDGAFAHSLLSPARHVDKTYYALIEGEMTEAHRQAFAAGLEIGEKKPALPADLKILSVRQGNPSPAGFLHEIPEQFLPQTEENDPIVISEVTITLHEGKYHQVKRMVSACGCRVLYLKRLSMGAYTLPENLGRGEFVKVGSMLSPETDNAAETDF